MARPKDSVAGRQILQTQLENYKVTRERCPEPQRSIFTALIQQLETELAKTLPVSGDSASAARAG